MVRLPFDRLRARLLLLVLLAILPALGLMLYTGLEHRRLAAEHAKEEAMRLVRIVSVNEKHLIEGTHQMLAGLSHVSEVRGGDACEPFLAGMLAKYPQYINLGVADGEGNVTCSALPLQAGSVNIADRAYFRKAVESGGFAIGSYQTDRIALR
ncbi:MAG: PAS domain S-box protein, partial [Acidobacteriota bacterium]